MTRNGKIARLPRSIRDELNRRLDDGEQGTVLVEWLNAHPEVKKVLGKFFENRPITECNLTDWKQGGFLEWKQLQEAGDFARMVVAESDHVAAQAGLVPLSDRLSAMVSLSLGKLIRELSSSSLSEEDKQEKFVELLKQLTRLRRDDHLAARLRMDVENHEINLPYRLRQNSMTAVPIRLPQPEPDPCLP
jgi:hypothetical protein